MGSYQEKSFIDIYTIFRSKLNIYSTPNYWQRSSVIGQFTQWLNKQLLL